MIELLFYIPLSQLLPLFWDPRMRAQLSYDKWLMIRARKGWDITFIGHSSLNPDFFVLFMQEPATLTWSSKLGRASCTRVGPSSKTWTLNGRRNSRFPSRIHSDQSPSVSTTTTVAWTMTPWEGLRLTPVPLTLKRKINEFIECFSHVPAYQNAEINTV